MSEFVLSGHHWTRGQTARHLGVPADTLAARQDILRIGGRWLQEVYPAVQFDADGQKAPVKELVGRLSDDLDAQVICDWLQRPNAKLSGASPIEWIDSDRPMAAVLNAVPDRSWLGSMGATG